MIMVYFKVQCDYNVTVYRETTAFPACSFSCVDVDSGSALRNAGSTEKLH
jgi:endogenous inhibitor of DNA gyrase (YacG/DUF329 family)